MWDDLKFALWFWPVFLLEIATLLRVPYAEKWLHRAEMRAGVR